MKVLSLFSGVGGFDQGLETAGMTTVFQCEWDKNATNILQRHWPDVPRWGDVSTLTGAYILEKTGGVDVVAWGSPCQDLSVAGKRAGITGERSGLFYEGIRIIKELRAATNGAFPIWSIWENVAGALSSNKGADFGEILDEMAEAGAVGLEYALLDAQYFGVPQRRRRVFVVACFDSATWARCPNPLLPVAQSLPGDSTSGISKGENPTTEVAACLRSGGDGGVPSSRGEHLVVESHLGSGDDIANTITAGLYHHGTVVNQDANNGHVVIESAAFVKVIRSGARAGDGSLPAEVWREETVAPTLSLFDQGDTRAVVAIVEAFQSSSHAGYSEGVATLRASGGDLGGGSETLLIDGRRNDDVRVYTEPVQTLEARMGTGGNNVPMIALPIADPDDPMFTLTGTDIHAVQSEMVVRRLTPRECERLQGFPDDFTKFNADGTVQSDTHRYKQMGNAVAVPVAAWVGKQIMRVNETAST